MTTSFADIYERAIFKIRDSKLASLNMADQEYVLKHYLFEAIAEFSPHCLEKIDDFDAENETFNVRLSNETQEILALGISVAWLDAQLRDKELLRNKLSTKDYQYFSPANLIREANTLRKTLSREQEKRIVNYTYSHGDIAMSGSLPIAR